MKTKIDNLYLGRYASEEYSITEKPQLGLEISVVIPCYNETRLLDSLQSIKNCELSSCSVEVIVVVNNSIEAPASVLNQNKGTLESVQSWAIENNSTGLRFFAISALNLPKKHAGVGLARKIGMDEAVRRFEWVKNNGGQPDIHEKGLIVCFDADSQCAQNYLMEVYSHFKKNQQSPGCSIQFAHPLEGNASLEIYQGICLYELYLRYYINGLQYAGYPYAFQTIGSSMAVRSEAYQKQGGMNRKKAGEDFYFLHKIIPLGNFTELNTTTVIPSPRSSDRVPFGTGKAISDWLQAKQDLSIAYNPAIFKSLKIFMGLVPELLEGNSEKKTAIPKPISDFLSQNNFEEKLNEVNSQTANQWSKVKRFFAWFDGLKVLKLVHHLRDNYYPSTPLTDSARWLLNEYHQTKVENSSPKDLLLAFRKIDSKRK